MTTTDQPMCPACGLPAATPGPDAAECPLHSWPVPVPARAKIEAMSDPVVICDFCGYPHRAEYSHGSGSMPVYSVHCDTDRQTDYYHPDRIIDAATTEIAEAR